MGERIEAELVADVREIVVRAGEAVRAGDTVVVLESMRLAIPVLAGSCGTVTQVEVAPGDVVQQGDVLATIA